MWKLIASQFQYRRLVLAVVGLTALVFLLPVTLLVDDLEDVGEILQLLVLGFGVGINVFLWSVDQHERRMLLWTVLPVRLEEIIAARLLSVIVVQGVAGAAALISLGVASHVHQAPLFDQLSKILGFQGLALLGVASIYLNEEISLLIGRSNWAIFMASTLPWVLFLTIALGPFNFPSYKTWAGIFVSHLATLGMLYLAYRMFLRRQSFLQGVSPVSGFPEDWSEAR